MRKPAVIGEEEDVDDDQGEEESGRLLPTWDETYLITYSQRTRMSIRNSSSSTSSTGKLQQSA